MKKKAGNVKTSTLLGEMKWYKTLTAIVVLAGGLIGIATGLFTLMRFLDRKPQKVQQNVEIVIDSSAAMNAAFEGVTKREAAIRAVSNYLTGQVTKAVADEDNLAFRVFGGECDDGRNTRLLVRFSQGNTRAIADASRNLKFAGQPTLVHAIIEAAGDFNYEWFKGVSKRIIVITGSADACQKDSAVNIIQTRLNDMAKQNGEKIEFDFRFIGLGLPPEQRAQLQNVAEATGGRADFAGTAKELDQLLTRTLRVEPVVNDIGKMREILNSVIQQQDAAIQSIEQNNPAAADSKLADARKTLQQTDLQFQDLGRHEGADQFQELFRQMYELAKRNRETQGKLLDVVGQMIEERKKNDTDALGKSNAERDQLVEQYNNNVYAIRALVDKVDEELQRL